MTHGEETGPETHQDSAVLTYLEGLLMHRVAGAQGATATERGEAGNRNEEQRNKETTGLTLPRHSTQQAQEKSSPHGGTTQHLRKARLLRSEAWTEHESKRRSAPPVEVNGRMEEHHSGLNGSSQCKGESTLLASLLQSFNTRLQNVALSQQIVQSLMPQDASSPVRKPDLEDKAPGHGHESGPSHFKGLTESSKIQNPSSTESYHHQRPSQERSAESPVVLQHSARSPSTDSLPCTERLKAVANLVNIRSSPAPSPKPSVACSQLALLLSSEAHLQQYSREQALKAQLAGRTASERLAAIATHQTQAKKQPSTSVQPQINQEGLSSLHTKNGIPAQMSTSSSRQSPNLSTGQSRLEGSVRRTHPFRERRPFERHGRPSQNCSSLLLQLLNSHNTPQQLNCQGHLKEDINVFSSRSSPLFSDSEHSNSGSSIHKDSSDAESTYSSCSPIDLSIKNKVNIPTPQSSSSSPALDKVTESLQNRWKPESPTVTVLAEPRDVHTSPEMKPHHKVTLLELLLDHKNNEKASRGLGNPDVQPITIPNVSNASTSSQTLFYAGRCQDTKELSPNCRLSTRSPKLLPTFSQGRDCNPRTSPYTLYSPSHTQSVPLDLCKTKLSASGVSIKESAFCASKLLQNLAQCGKQNAPSSPSPKAPSLPPIKRQTQELNTSSSATLLDRLTTPIQKSSTPTWEAAQAKPPAVTESTQHGSEIENLLERRTVLQLLLGNKSQREQIGHKRKRESGKTIPTENQTKCHHNLNRPSPDILIKTESVEDGEMCNNKVTMACQRKLAESPRHGSHTLNQGSVKQEPLSPVEEPRDGLLCHLLQQQQHKTLKPVSIEDSKKGFIKEEPVEHQGPTIPKKRKFSIEPEDHAEVSQQGVCNTTGSQKANSDGSTSGIPETQKSSSPSSPPEADSPPAKFPPYESPSNENRGFNVLKQLLLSDNCLKELSQSRNTFSPLTHPVLNGSTIKEPHNNGELQSFHQHLSPNRVSAVKASTNRPASYSEVYVPQLDSSRSKPEMIAPFRDLKASGSLVNGNDKTQDCQLDSPRLTKANPILYYMLQRSNAHLVREARDLEARSGQCRVQLKVKEESEAFDLKLNLQQNPHNHNGSHCCDSPRLNGSLKKL